MDEEKIKRTTRDVSNSYNISYIFVYESRGKAIEYASSYVYGEMLVDELTKAEAEGMAILDAVAASHGPGCKYVSVDGVGNRQDLGWYIRYEIPHDE